jgi:two-component system chemotaxis response regulator CheB
MSISDANGASRGVPARPDRQPLRDVVVVGASAGGVEALTRFVRALPADLAATVLVVLHIPARAPSALATILDRHSSLPARTAGDREPLERGVILVAPPDYHLVLREDGVATVHGPRENGHRPSIDALFRSAAWELGPRVVGVMLSGSDDDGTVGALAVRQRGGMVCVQARDDAMYATMPMSVARQVGADAEGSAHELGVLVGRLCRSSEPPPAGHAPLRALPSELESASDLAEEAAVSENKPEAVLGEPLGAASGFVCPDCSGALFTIAEVPVLRFRCRIGHAWTADGLVAQQALTVETALWTAVRTLQERADLSERLAHRAVDDGRLVSAEQFTLSAEDARAAARVLQELLSVSAGEAQPHAGISPAGESAGL